MFLDFHFILQWWLTLFIIGIVAFPFTNLVFSQFLDKGYIFGKIIGLAILSYCILLLATLHILPFHLFSLYFILGIFTLIGFFLLRKSRVFQKKLITASWKLYLFEEILFFAILVGWSFVRGFEPSIHGLEKFMDFGFVNSILRTEYFPTADMWFSGNSINYYYFGHIATAVLTRFSGIDVRIAFNLMIATLCAFTLVGSFSLGLNLFASFEFVTPAHKNKLLRMSIIVGLVACFLATFAGNLHTIYGLFVPYNPDNPVPFWQLAFNGFGENFFKGYWYPNATRFIPFTIHEFPLYSFVVSDLHGHVLDIPFVLTTLAFALLYLKTNKEATEKNILRISLRKNILLEIKKVDIPFILMFGLMLAIMYMTNAWDGLIYLGFVTLVFFYTVYKEKKNLSDAIYYSLTKAIIVFLLFLIFSLPFSLFFKPFVSGVGILCAPEVLVQKGHIGPFLFEPDHCRRSPIYMLFILWGYFLFFAVSFLLFTIFSKRLLAKSLLDKLKERVLLLSPSEVFISIAIILSTLLLLFPEFAYMKDIYPEHYRANTMFKLGYQAFIMMSICSSVIFFRIALSLTQTKKITGKITIGIFILISFILSFFVAIYPYFAITSYYGNLKNYQGLTTSLSFLSSSYPDDYNGIEWMRKHIQGQPVILEAVGDSYTDYARVSAMTGIPTVVGWPVHEWLWRGTYDVPAPRITDVQTIYETPDVDTAKRLLKKYHVNFIFLGTLERQKYPGLTEDKFDGIGDVIFQSGTTKIYQVK